MAEMQIKCPECSRALKVQSEWCGKNVKCPLCQSTFIVPDTQAPAEPSQVQTDNFRDDVKMMINDDIEATPEKIVEMLEAVAGGKEEFVILSFGKEFLQTCLIKKKKLFNLEYNPSGKAEDIIGTDVEDFDVIQKVFLKFYERDLSFKLDVTWEYEGV